MTMSRRAFVSLTAAVAVGSRLAGIPAAASDAAAAAHARTDRLGHARMRGMTTKATITQSDVEAFAATGGNVLRPTFSGLQLMSKNPPYELNESAFAQLDRLLDWCEQVNVRVIIDPHTFPGVVGNGTTLPTDAIWSDYAFHDLAAILWDEISRRYADRGSVIGGYDLLNEPAVPDIYAQSGPASWNELLLRLAQVVRANDQTHTLIIGSAISPRPEGGRWYSRMEGVNALPPPPDANVLVSPHLYTPHAFSFQGISPNYPFEYTYPGQVMGMDFEGLDPVLQPWNRRLMYEHLLPVLDYTEKYGVGVFLGEFSAARWLGQPGNHYLRDCINLFEHFGWHWCYHAWREFQGWDAERSNDDQADLTRYSTTPRMRLLRKYFARNS